MDILTPRCLCILKIIGGGGEADLWASSSHSDYSGGTVSYVTNFKFKLKFMLKLEQQFDIANPLIIKDWQKRVITQFY